MNMSVQEPAAPRPASSPPNLALLVSLFEPLQQRQPLFSTAHVEPGQFWYFTSLVVCLHTRRKRSKVCKHRDGAFSGLVTYYLLPTTYYRGQPHCATLCTFEPNLSKCHGNVW